MTNYFELLSLELLNKLNQVKIFIKKHNPTIGVVTEEILRDFLRRYLPKVVSVEQGFVLNQDGDLSRQCDIIIYDSNRFSPFYRINDIVVVPEESVIAIIEVKTTINKQIFHKTIEYFSELGYRKARTYLFIYNSQEIGTISNYFHSYRHKGLYQLFDHDTFQLLPDEITGINSSYHLRKDGVITDTDQIGYASWHYEDLEGTEINALQHFYLSIYSLVEEHIKKQDKNFDCSRSLYYKKTSKGITAFPLFDM